MLFVAYLNPFEIQRIFDNSKYNPDKIEKIWKKTLGYVPLIACGSDIPENLFVSCTTYIPDCPAAVLYFYTPNAIKIDKEAYYRKRNLIQTSEGRPLMPYEILSCRNDEVSDDKALFICNLEKRILLIKLQDLYHNPKQHLKQQLSDLFGTSSEYLAKTLSNNIQCVSHGMRRIDASLWNKDSDTNKEGMTSLQELFVAKNLNDYCILPFIATSACDYEGEDIEINVYTDLECLFYGLCCVHRVQDLSWQYMSMLLSPQLYIEDKGDELLKTLHECYIEDPRVLTAHQIGINSNDPCPCGCGKKWKKHYGGIIENTIKALYPNTHRTYAPMPSVIPTNLEP